MPEIWCYDSGALNIYHLQTQPDHEDDYVEAKTSLALPNLPVRQLPDIIEAHRSDGRRAIRKAIRQWVRGNTSDS